MNMHQDYDLQKEKQIRNLLTHRNETTDLEKIYAFNNSLFKIYQFYNFNNALRYIEGNIQIANQLENLSYINESKLKLGLLLVNTGRYKESIDALNEVVKKTLPNILLDNYYIAFSEGYSGLAFNTTVNSSKLNYTQLYLAYQDSLYSRLKLDSEEALRVKEKEFRDNRNLKMALEINNQRLSKVNDGSRLFSLITFERSLLYELEGNITEQKKYLVLSAISDIKSSVKDNASLGTLAKILFKEGDIDRAHRYINFSYDDAEFYNSNLRFVNIANSMPLITKAYEEKTAKQKERLQELLIFISILSVFLLVAVYLIYKQVQKVSLARNELKTANEDLRKLYKELSEVDKIKEHYIGNFLNLYSEYISKLDVYRKLVSKYVNANQMNALLKLSKSKQLIDEELEIFNKNFDSSFLHIYPDFVDAVNKLLKQDNQIHLEDKTKLNTELRILALIKLGITSSSKIAKILRYSVNTIYNYRASIKSMSKDKALFEDLIKKIQ
ncbi:transcriptional regulator [Hyunsoonleella pacifica]|nr:transcriptional regulator [Hyunsoonleella pacifica]